MSLCVARVLSGRIGVSKLTVELKIPVRRLYATTVKRPERKDVLTALHHANVLLPTILPQTQASHWTKLIGTLSDIISGVTYRKARIAVLGLDALAQPTELVSALLDDPLSSDSRNRDALRNRRREHRNDVLIVSHGELDVSTPTIHLNLPWLNKLNAEIVEIPTTHPDLIALLYDADVQILVMSPLTGLVPRELEALLVNSDSFLILNYPTIDQRVADFAVSRLVPRTFALAGTVMDRLFYAYPPKALSALDLFSQSSNSAGTTQAFQDDFLDSGMTVVSRAISQALSVDDETRTFHHAQLVLTGALEACHSVMANASRDVATVQHISKELRARVDHAHELSVREVLGGDDAPAVAEAVKRSKREMETVVRTLQWWKLPFKVDDLGDTLSCAVERTWCRDLSAKLHFETGRLSSRCATLTADTHATLRLLPTSFHSALLNNTLHQLTPRPPDLALSTLTYPLNFRLQQLQHPIVNLHWRAQRIMLTAVTTTLSSVGGAYAAWFVGWIAPATAVGLGALGAVASLRWLVGDWEKGKKRWWGDWRRVGEGLERDIKNVMAVVVREKVAAVPRRAAEELEQSVVLRLSETERMNAKLESLDATLRCLYPQERLP